MTSQAQKKTTFEVIKEAIGLGGQSQQESDTQPTKEEQYNPASQTTQQTDADLTHQIPSNQPDQRNEGPGVEQYRPADDQVATAASPYNSDKSAAVSGPRRASTDPMPIPHSSSNMDQQDTPSNTIDEALARLTTESPDGDHAAGSFGSTRRVTDETAGEMHLPGNGHATSTDYTDSSARDVLAQGQKAGDTAYMPGHGISANTFQSRTDTLGQPADVANLQGMGYAPGPASMAGLPGKMNVAGDEHLPSEGHPRHHAAGVESAQKAGEGNSPDIGHATRLGNGPTGMEVDEMSGAAYVPGQGIAANTHHSRTDTLGQPGDEAKAQGMGYGRSRTDTLGQPGDDANLQGMGYGHSRTDTLGQPVNEANLHGMGYAPGHAGMAGPPGKTNVAGDAHLPSEGHSRHHAAGVESGQNTGAGNLPGIGHAARPGSGTTGMKVNEMSGATYAPGQGFAANTHHSRTDNLGRPADEANLHGMGYAPGPAGMAGQPGKTHVAGDAHLPSKGHPGVETGQKAGDPYTQTTGYTTGTGGSTSPTSKSMGQKANEKLQHAKVLAGLKAYEVKEGAKGLLDKAKLAVTNKGSTKPVKGTYRNTGGLGSALVGAKGDTVRSDGDVAGTDVTGTGTTGMGATRMDVPTVGQTGPGAAADTDMLGSNVPRGVATRMGVADSGAARTGAAGDFGATRTGVQPGSGGARTGAASETGGMFGSNVVGEGATRTGVGSSGATRTGASADTGTL